MIAIGIVDFTQPDSFKDAMDGISMPHYILWILGIAKTLGGLTILLLRQSILVEWAFAGFFIWAAGGIASHLLSGHGLVDTAPILGLSAFLFISYLANHFESLMVTHHEER